MPEIKLKKLLPNTSWHDGLIYLLAVAVIFAVKDNPFFWDTTQFASRHAHFYFENGFSKLLLPDEMDSGHPPFFGMYIALCWKIFGKSLVVSHFAMLPFIFLVIYFIKKISQLISHASQANYLLLLVFADPVVASQFILVSPDLVLFAFFVLAVWAILDGRHPYALALAACVLAIVSTRGMMLCFALFCFSLFARNDRSKHQKWHQELLLFLPAGFISVSFLIIHFFEKGWIGFHTDSPWAPSFQMIDFQGIIKNLAITLWRLIDFGRLFLWLLLGGLFYVFYRRRITKAWLFDVKNKIAGKLLALLILTGLTLLLVQLPFRGLLAHRYLLPVFLTLTFLFFHLLTLPEISRRWRKGLFVSVFFGLATGNFWIYPKNIAIGWDSTLAHIPWYNLIREMDEFVETNGFRKEDIGTAFPNIGSGEVFFLNGKRDSYSPKDLQNQCYVLWSNVMNDFTEIENTLLYSEWKELKRLESGFVCLILYQNPGKILCAN
jgi:hypothetical protein